MLSSRSVFVTITLYASFYYNSVSVPASKYGMRSGTFYAQLVWSRPSDTFSRPKRVGVYTEIYEAKETTASAIASLPRRFLLNRDRTCPYSQRRDYLHVVATVYELSPRCPIKRRAGSLVQARRPSFPANPGAMSICPYEQPQGLSSNPCFPSSAMSFYFGVFPFSPFFWILCAGSISFALLSLGVFLDFPSVRPKFPSAVFIVRNVATGIAKTFRASLIFIIPVCTLFYLSLFTFIY